MTRLFRAVDYLLIASDPKAAFALLGPKMIAAMCQQAAEDAAAVDVVESRAATGWPKIETKEAR